MWDIPETQQHWLQPSILRVGFETLGTLLGWPLPQDRSDLMWAFQEIFPTSRWRDRQEICRKLSKLVEEHGKKNIWNAAYGQGAWAEERAEGRLWDSWAKNLFVFLAVFKATKLCMLENKWGYTTGAPGRFQSERRKIKSYKVWLIAVVQVMNFRRGKFNHCLSNFLFKVLSLSKFLFSGFLWIFLFGSTEIWLKYPWSESLPVAVPSFLSS